ncbi:MAG: DUF5682 family protein [Pseudomonadota bacterium]
MSIHLFGIRHHGPGCARSLAQALQALQPDCILIEGPPEADELIRFVANAGLQPPVALLVYMPAAPQQAVFYPFAEFSPEWQAMRYACEHGVPVRFCDLPQAHRLAPPPVALPEDAAADADADADADAASASADIQIDIDPGAGKNIDIGADNDAGPGPGPGLGDDAGAGDTAPAMRTDPLHWLAGAAGYSDTETWWDHLVEQRADSLDLFAAIAEMMTVVRTEIAPPLDLLESRREAYMRSMIRQAEKQGHQRIAVVCGAYHVPALAAMPSAKSDADILKGLPKVKLAATWTPWSYGRLAFHSGYGAGVEAPGWYHHLWNKPAQAGLHWLTDVANLLRRHDLDASSAHIIEASRLADTLAAMRDRPRAGLDELQEAVRAVFCYDSDAPLRLIRHALLVNDRLGQVPPDVPVLPLPQDVQAQQKRLRLAVRADVTQLDLDLREPAQLEKSILLHRLALLGIDWGRSQHAHGKSGTFHELWRLAWQPEFALRLIEANVWGGTLEGAAGAYALSQAAAAGTLPELTALVEKVLLADLRDAVGGVMQRIQDVGALTPDLGFMLAALPPLANVMRYGSVRGTDTGLLSHVVDGLVARACIALPFGVRALADEAAADLVKQVIAADHAIRLLQRDDYLAPWFAALAQAALSDGAHMLVAGRCTRILTEQGHWSTEQAAQQLSLRCSHASLPLHAAHWLEGFLQGSGALLIHNDKLWELISAWLSALQPDIFIELLPLLRRTFGTFAMPERRELAERAASGPAAARPAALARHDIDEARARRILPVLATILGAAAAPEEQHAG